jgi:glutamine synthetase
MLMAALDGIENQIDPGPPSERNLYELTDAERADIRQTPDSLDGALRALEQDHAFLLKGNVCTEDVIRYWIKYKMEHEVNALRSRPHPYEFCLYFDL